MPATVAKTILLFSALLTNLPCWAQEKIKVGVEFSIVKLNYRQFRPAELGTLQAEVAKVIAAKLQRSARYLNFVTEAGARYKLRLVLDDIDTSRPGGLSDTVFHVELSGDGTERLQSGQWKFRLAEEFEKPIPPIDQFQAEILRKVNDGEVAPIALQLLSKIPIAQKALVWNSPRGWAIVHRLADICLADQSRLEIGTEVEADGAKGWKIFQAVSPAVFVQTTAPAAYRQSTYLQPDAGQPGLDQYPWARPRVVDAEIYVKSNSGRARNCRVPPDELANRADGGPR